MSFLKGTGKAMADLIPGLGRLTFDGQLGKVFVTSGKSKILTEQQWMKLSNWQTNKLTLKFTKSRFVLQVLESSGTVLLWVFWMQVTLTSE